MTKETPWEEWERFSNYTRDDLEKSLRSTPERRRRQNRINVAAVIAIYLISIVGDFIGHDYDERWKLIVDLIIPNPLAGLAMAYFASASALARKSRLTDEEARSLADECEEKHRENREFAKWLWTGKKPDRDGE